MGFNKDKKKKLAYLLAKRRAAAAGVGTSTPRAPSISATFAPHPIEPAPADDRQKGVVAVDTDDEDTCTSLVFKRQRVGEVVVSSPSASGGTPTFRDNPQVPPPRAISLFTKVGERVPMKAKKCFPPPSSPRCCNKSSNASKIRRCWRA